MCLMDRIGEEAANGSEVGHERQMQACSTKESQASLQASSRYVMIGAVRLELKAIRMHKHFSAFGRSIRAML